MKKNPIVTAITLFTFCTTMALPLAAFAKPGDSPQTTVTDGTPRVDQKIDITVQPAPVKFPKKLTVDGTVKIEDPVKVTGKVAIDGPVVLDLSKPISVDMTKPVTVELPLLKSWWFWTAVGLLTTGAIVGGVCGGGYCGGTHHNEMRFQ